MGRADWKDSDCIQYTDKSEFCGDAPAGNASLRPCGSLPILWARPVRFCGGGLFYITYAVPVEGPKGREITASVRNALSAVTGRWSRGPKGLAFVTHCSRALPAKNPGSHLTAGNCFTYRMRRFFSPVPGGAWLLPASGPSGRHSRHGAPCPLSGRRPRHAPHRSYPTTRRWWEPG